MYIEIVKMVNMFLFNEKYKRTNEFISNVNTIIWFLF